MSAYDDAEESVEGASAREYFTISLNGIATHRHTTASQDLVIGGVIYTAIASERGELVVPGVNAGGDFKFQLPIDHAFVRRFCLQGVPPSSASIQWYRILAGESRLLWTGEILSMSIEGRVATFYSPYRAMEAIKRSLPTVSAGRDCSHQLYSTSCGVARASFKTTTTVLAVDGRYVTAGIGTTDATWVLHGELVHTLSGERRTIRYQTVLATGSPTMMLDLQVQIPELQVGHSIDLYAGCNHTMAQCHDRFANRQRYGGFNRMARQNVFKFTNKGTKSTGEM